MKKIASILFLISCIPFWANAQAQVEMPEKKHPTAIAIIIDSASFANARKAVMDYKRMLENTQGLSAYIVAYSWKKPEEVRNSIRGLYRRTPLLEGALLVGDIPIAMIRDAQQLTSVFKMDQRVDWKRSSVPSDRFYDDFHLQFTFLKRDSARSDYFYYSLSPSSPQRINMNIYTSRVKPPVIPGKSKYELLRQWFEQRVAESATPNRLDNMLVYTGFGYHSESQAAWAGEQLALKDQLPDLYKPGGSVKFMNFRMADAMKPILLSELQRDELDIAIFHEHGDPTTQLINGYPNVSNPNPSIANIRRYLRSKIQAAQRKKQNIGEVKARFAESLNVPLSWMEDALADSVILADSLMDAGQNIATEDLAAVHTNARIVYLDACDNGSFHLDDYVSGRYVFSGGRTAVAMANSVGVLQDLWSDQMIGLLQHGVRVGNWFKQIAYLETHLAGDPTYSFEAPAADKAELNRHIVYDTANATPWKRYLQSGDADQQVLALYRLYALQKDSLSSLLKNTYFQSPYAVVRLAALQLLEKLNNADYTAVLMAAVRDPYELIRRLSVYHIADRGDDAFIPALVSMALSDAHSERVKDRVKVALSFMNSGPVIREIEKQLAAATWLVNGKELKQTLLANQQETQKKIATETATLKDKKKPAKERLFTLRTIRAYNYHVMIPDVLQLILDKSEEPSLRLTAMEAVSWFNKSYQTPLILDACNKVLDDKDSSAELKARALHTRNILKAG